MLTRFLLLLAGLLAGLWLRTSGLGISPDALLVLVAIALLVAALTAPRAEAADARSRAEDAYRAWLDAWQRAQAHGGATRGDAEADLAIVGADILILAPDRVVRALRSATDAGYSRPAVAHLVLEMRRSLRRAGLAVRPADIERLLASPVESAPAEYGHPGGARAALRA